MLRLRGEVGGEQRSFPLVGDRVTVGRSLGNDVVLADPSVSRKHAVLERDGEAWFVVDRGSTNGVQLNGSTVRRSAVRKGDVLGIGGFALAVEVAEVGRPDDDSPVATADLSREGLAASLVRPLSEFTAAYGLAPGAGEEKREDLDQAYGNRIFGHLLRLAGLLQSAVSVDEVLTRVTDVAFEALPVQRGFILLLDEEGEAVCELARQGEQVELRPGGPVPVSRTILEAVLGERLALITHDARADHRLKAGESIRLHNIRAAMCAPLWSGDRIIGVVQVDSPFRVGTFTAADLDFLTALANFAAVAVESLRNAERVAREQRLRGRLERYHSPQVIEAVMGREEGWGEGETHLAPAEATVLFADLAGFTSFAEGADPGAVAELLKSFFNSAVDAVFAAGGTLDKFIGDCVMAFFGAPVEQPDHARRAVAAAVDLQRRLAQLDRERTSRGLVGLTARVGINTGPVVVGEIGSRRRVEYTVLGNTVNVAARLESFAAAPGEVIVGPETHRQLAGEVETEPLGELQLKGLSRAIPAYRVVRRW